MEYLQGKELTLSAKKFNPKVNPKVTKEFIEECKLRLPIQLALLGYHPLSNNESETKRKDLVKACASDAIQTDLEGNFKDAVNDKVFMNILGKQVRFLSLYVYT